jgi:hypothetical protein
MARFVYPKVVMNGCNRCFVGDQWLKYSWLVYSVAEDGVICLPCALFCSILESKDGLSIDHFLVGLK